MWDPNLFPLFTKFLETEYHKKLYQHKENYRWFPRPTKLWAWPLLYKYLIKSVQQ